MFNKLVVALIVFWGLNLCLSPLIAETASIEGFSMETSELKPFYTNQDLEAIEAQTSRNVAQLAAKHDRLHSMTYFYKEMLELAIWLIFGVLAIYCTTRTKCLVLALLATAYLLPELIIYGFSLMAYVYIFTVGFSAWELRLLKAT